MAKSNSKHIEETYKNKDSFVNSIHKQSNNRSDLEDGNCKNDSTNKLKDEIEKKISNYLLCANEHCYRIEGNFEELVQKSCNLLGYNW